MNKKIGPLPMWAWAVVGGLALYVVYRYYQNSAANNSTTAAATGTTGILDPNAVDPNTGLTYGQEESAALNANAAQLGGTSGGSVGTPTDSGAQGTVTAPANEFGDFLTFLQEWDQFAQSVGYQAPGTAGTATAPPPVQGSSPPTTSPSTHTAPSLISSIQGVPHSIFNSIYNEGFNTAYSGHPQSAFNATTTAAKYGLTPAVATQIYAEGFSSYKKPKAKAGK